MHSGSMCRYVFNSACQVILHAYFNLFVILNSLDPDQTEHFVRPDPDSNCLQRLAAGDKPGH